MAIITSREGIHSNRARVDYCVFTSEGEDGGECWLQDEVLQAHAEVPLELVSPLATLRRLDKSLTLLGVREYQWLPLHTVLSQLERQRDTNLGLSQVTAHKVAKAKGNSKEAKTARAKSAATKPIFNGLSMNEIDMLINALTKAKMEVK